MFRPRMRYPFVPVGESMTEQSHAYTCDINNVVARHARLGSLPPADKPAYYGDVTRLQAPLAERIAFSEDMIGRYEEFVATQASSPAAPADSPPVSPGESVPGAV